MSTNFELCSVPRSIFVGWSLDVTELSLISSVIVVDVQRQLD